MILLVPGYTGSGPEHWQTRWEESLPGARRVQQRDWDAPVCADWVAALDAAVAACDEPPLLVAHSCGVPTVVHWARRARRVRGALLVAPPDLDNPAVPAPCLTFAPVPRARLPFASILVASSDDPYCAIDHARALAVAWGSRFVDVGACGHINSDSRLGRWPVGLELLASL